jgi:hypothetical protein
MWFNSPAMLGLCWSIWMSNRPSPKIEHDQVSARKFQDNLKYCQPITHLRHELRYPVDPGGTALCLCHLVVAWYLCMAKYANEWGLISRTCVQEPAIQQRP